ncbi:MAG: two-component regulator propeller domain-containing protein [Candidatus Sulfotelmatobacter sp.]
MRHPVALKTTPSSVVLACFVLACFVLAWCVCACALDPSLDVNQYAHTAWKIREGFAKGEILSIAQTPDGYLWLGTESGLLRFDGVRPVLWQPPNREQLPSNHILALLVARDDTLWIGTYKGLASWKDGKLTHYREVAGANVPSLLEDQEGTVWFGAYERSKGRLCAIRAGKVACEGDRIFGDGVLALYRDHKGNLWASSDTGLWRWVPGPPERYAFPRGVVEANSLVEDDGGALLLATSDGLKQLVATRIEDYPLRGVSGHFRPVKFLRSSDGSLWIGTQQGLLHLHHGRVDGFRAIDGLSGDFIENMFEDREGNIWVATMEGLDRFRGYTIPTISRNQGLSNSTAWSAQATPDGSVWIGTPDGINRLANGHVTVYRSRGALVQTRHGDKTEPNLSGAATEIVDSGLKGTPHSLGLDDAGRLWTSTNEGVFYFDRGRFVRVTGIPGGNTYSIAGDGHGNVWILHAGAGIFYWSPKAAIQQIPWSQPGQKTALTILPDREPGSLWLGFQEGGVAHLKDGKIVRSYGAADGLGDGVVAHLRFGSRGAVWAATEAGLSRINIKDGHIETLSSKNGLPCDDVHWSMEDDDHALWVYMPCGLARIERSEWYAWVDDPRHIIKSTIFDTSEGVRSVGRYGGYGPHVTKSADGRIWFLPKDGVSVIDPRHLPVNKLPPPVHIEQVTVDNQPNDAVPGLRLPPHARDVEISFTALSFVDPGKMHFRYKLEGFNRNWHDIERRQVHYANLPPGNYRFRVMACNNSGVWNEAGTFLDFSIAPAYYQATWFRALCGAAFLVLLWAIYQLRVQHLQRQFNIGLEARVNERTRIARDLHDTMLQTFQGVLLKFYGLSVMLADRPEAQEKLEGLLEQGRQAVNEGREAVLGLRSSTVIANDLARAFTTFGGELALKRESCNPVVFQVEVEGETQDLHPILRDEVYRIACEALRNAFQHSGAARIEVGLHYGDRQFRVYIRDDGKGIDRKVLDAGGREGHYGLAGMRERAKLAGGRLVVRSRVTSGTEAEIMIPAALAYAKSRSPRWSAFLRRGA